MERINPIVLLIGFNVVFFAARGFLLPEGSTAQFGSYVEATLASLGVLGHLSVLALYTVCSFFFVPLLIPLNILCGALYGPYVGTVISIIGITLGCFASTISVRHVFKGMQHAIDRRPMAQKILANVARHGAIMVIAVRLAFVVPYLLQNIVLAATSVSIYRLGLLTLIGSLPGAAIYSFLGAGLVQSDNANELALYLAVPLALLVLISIALKRFNAKYQSN
jgi:uncharacterized membrane protein YdjX (TVP38/TMEM64 family)